MGSCQLMSPSSGPLKDDELSAKPATSHLFAEALILEQACNKIKTSDDISYGTRSNSDEVDVVRRLVSSKSLQNQQQSALI
jgi:hypothetical protein